MGRHSASPPPQGVERPAARPGAAGRGTLGPITDPVLLDAIQQQLAASRAGRTAPAIGRAPSARPLPTTDPEPVDGTVWIETPFSGPVRIEVPPSTDGPRPAQPAGPLRPVPARSDGRRSSLAMPATTVDGRAHLVTTLDDLAAPRPAFPVARPFAAPFAALAPPLPDRSPAAPPTEQRAAEQRAAPFPPSPVQPAAAMRTDDDAAPPQDVGVSREALLLALGVGAGLAVVLSIVAVLPI